MSDKCYIVSWNSDGNITNPEDVVINASSIMEAQDKFLSWVKEQSLYRHMWNLSFNIREGVYVR